MSKNTEKFVVATVGAVVVGGILAYYTTTESYRFAKSYFFGGDREED